MQGRMRVGYFQNREQDAPSTIVVGAFSSLLVGRMLTGAAFHLRRT